MSIAIFHLKLLNKIDDSNQLVIFKTLLMNYLIKITLNWLKKICNITQGIQPTYNHVDNYFSCEILIDPFEMTQHSFSLLNKFEKYFMTFEALLSESTKNKSSNNNSINQMDWRILCIYIRKGISW